MKKFRILSAALIGLIALQAAGCSLPLGGREKQHKLSFLKAEGEQVLDANGNEVSLRGVNAGGLGVIEQWMTGFARSSSEDSSYVARDHYTTTKVWLDRFGEKDTLTLWENYQAAWWTEADFKNCAEMGINVIRLPFTYMNIDFDAVVSYENAGGFDFTFLDNFVDTAEEYGIYTILDLHGAYGSQNGQDHSGQIIDSAAGVTFYENEEYLSLTEELWRAVAEHFKDHPGVAGYDLLNEPVEKGQGETGEKHWNALDRFYRAIRETGDEHIAIFESCWGANGLPMPETYGWENCMYSFHHYTGCADDEHVEEHCKSFADRLDEVEERGFGVPLYMGEFTCYTNETQWTVTLDLMNVRGWHWTSWTYKIWGSSGWGIYNIATLNETKIDAHRLDYVATRKSFRAVLTETNATPFTFPSGKTLFSVIQDACKGEEA